MTIGLLTFHFAHNYGAALQAYALMSFLEYEGHDIEIINYRPAQMYAQYALNPLEVKGIKRMIRKAIDVPRRRSQFQKFESFLEEYLRICELGSNFGKYDTIIVGSDQVWNESLTHSDPMYFLKGYRGKKYSYAASFGYSSLERANKENLILLNDFDAISLREMDCVGELKEMVGDKPVCQTCDPVFLLSRKKWLELSSNVWVDEKYVLYYSLQENTQLKTEAQKAADALGADLLVVHPTCLKQGFGRELTNVGPREFISLINGAEEVFTNSFHALAFSSIFERKACVSFHTQTSSRARELLRLHGVEPVGDGIMRLDFSSADKSQLEKLKIDSRRYLHSVIG